MEFSRECVAFFAEAVQLFGVPKSVGQIYGVLYASPVPLSFSDIVGQLDISKGSASQGLQLLRSLGAINVADRGNDEPRGSTSQSQTMARVTRVVTYEPELSLRRLVVGVLHERIAPFTGISSRRLARLHELAEKLGDGNDFYLDRARQLNIWRRRLKAVLPVLSALLGPIRKK